MLILLFVWKAKVLGFTYGGKEQRETRLVFFLGSRVPEHSHDMLWQPPDLSAQAPPAEVEVHLPDAWKKQMYTPGSCLPCAASPVAVPAGAVPEL